MFKAHMDAIETSLLASSRVPAHSGHGLHKGGPRESFIRKFLSSHLPETLAIGTGEIIDSSSRPGDSRNQHDIVIYDKSYPKLDFGGGIGGFLVESVIATIEVKSRLTKQGLSQAVAAARNAKSLVPKFVDLFEGGHVPPKVINYVVAYDGPASMDTAQLWLDQIHQQERIVIEDLPLGDARLSQASPSIDAMFVLGKGFSYFDNVPNGFNTAESRATDPGVKWIYADSGSGSLLMLFLLLQSAVSCMRGRLLDPIPYLSSVKINNIKGSFGLPV